MPGKLTVLGLTVVLGAVFYQTYLKTLIFVTFGVGRDLRPIQEFPYECRRIRDPRLHACEDAWLSEDTRQLFLACSDSLARTQWMPNVDRLNASGRALEDAVIAMNIDKPDGDSFEYRVLKTSGYSGIHGDGRLHLVGITGVDGPTAIQLFLINNRPSVDSVTGELLDNKKTGANSTIEHFETTPAAHSLKHVKTYFDPQIATPNNIAVVGPNSFYFTNDHGPHKAGLKHQLAPLASIGDVSYCDGTTCTRSASGIAFANGLVKGHDGLIYVPSAWNGGITVFKPKPDNSLEKVDYIDIPYPMDNLKVDAKGDIFAAGIPKALGTLQAFEHPLAVTPSAAVLRISKNSKGQGYTVDKIMEDGNAEVLPGATAAVHDVKTGRFFITGVTAPFITVCDPK